MGKDSTGVEEYPNQDKLHKISVLRWDSNPGLPDGRPRCEPHNHTSLLCANRQQALRAYCPNIYAVSSKSQQGKKDKVENDFWMGNCTERVTFGQSHFMASRNSGTIRGTVVRIFNPGGIGILLQAQCELSKTFILT